MIVYHGSDIMVAKLIQQSMRSMRYMPSRIGHNGCKA